MSVDHSSKLCNIFRSLFLKSNTSDVTLVVENKRFPVHRVILATQSDFFRNIFYTANQNTLNIDAPVEAFELVLKYFYTGIFCLVQREEVLLDIRKLARLYGLYDLEEALPKTLPKGQQQLTVTLDNVEQVIKTGSILTSEKLLKKCCGALNQHCETFFTSQTFFQLTADEVAALMYHDSLKVADIDKFKAIAAWLNEHPDCTAASKETLLKSIDVTRFSKHQLATIVVPAKVYDSEVLLEMLAEQIQGSCSDDTVENSTMIIYGKAPGQICNEKDFIESNMGQEIVIDLGCTKTFNYIQFNLGTKASYDITLYTANGRECAIDDLLWSYLRAYRNRTSDQRIYLPDITARFIRITGLKELNGFKVKQTDLPKKVDERVKYLTETKIDSMNASVYNAVATMYDALCWDFVDKGEATVFNQSTRNGQKHFIYVSLKERLFLKTCRFRLWDYDGRTYSFALYSCPKDKNVRLEKDFKNVNGWQEVTLVPDEISLFTFKSDKEIRLVHFEAT